MQNHKIQIMSRRLLIIIPIVTITTMMMAPPPTRALETIYEDAKLLASDGSHDDYLGWAVAVSGDVAVIGASHDEPFDLKSGSVYVYRFDGANWNEEQKLIASNGDVGSIFGTSVGIDGDVIVVGASGKDSCYDKSGAAYVFEYDGFTWNETAYLVTSDCDEEDRFGCAVAISGNTIVVGAHQNEDAGFKSGSAYIFKDEGTGWTELAKLTASDAAVGDNFGEAVAISYDTAVIGARYDSDLGTMSGSAYIFEMPIGGWIDMTETAKLLPSNGGEEEFFGTGVAISDDTIAIGAPEADGRLGVVYIYERPVGGWITTDQENAQLTASDAAYRDYLGWDVAISGDMVIAGAYGDDDNGDFTGSAYAFQKPPTGWEDTNEIVKLLASDGAQSDIFGHCVAVAGNTAVVGAYWDDDNGAESGSAYVYESITAPPTLTIDPHPLRAGEDATFTVKHANPNTHSYLAYSLHGMGSTYVPPLNVTVDLQNPKQAGNRMTSDEFGTVVWTLPVPGNAGGVDVWLQAVQYELKTNVIETWVLP